MSLRFVCFMLLISTCGGALACPPPIPGVPEPPPPTAAERAQYIARSMTTIAYGMVTSETGDEPRFRIIHVYRGPLKVGQVIKPQLAWGFDPPLPCPGMVSPPPAFKGDYGVIAFRDDPKLSFIPADVLQELFKAGAIKSVRAAPSR